MPGCKPLTQEVMSETLRGRALPFALVDQARHDGGSVQYSFSHAEKGVREDVSLKSLDNIETIFYNISCRMPINTFYEGQCIFIYFFGHTFMDTRLFLWTMYESSYKHYYY